MQILQGMDPDKGIIIIPAALVAMYVILSLQKSLCNKQSKWIGLILPAICFVVATVLAVRPLFVADASEYTGLAAFCIRMWLTFNIVTIVFLVPYYKRIKEDRMKREAPAGDPPAQTGSCCFCGSQEPAEEIEDSCGSALEEVPCEAADTEPTEETGDSQTL